MVIFKNDVYLQRIKRSFFNSNESFVQTAFMYCCCVK